MPPNSPTARALARRLFAPAGSPTTPEGHPSDPVAAAERVFGLLAGELARWFGPFGYHALLTRALATAQDGHPALAAVRVRSALEPRLDGLADAARADGADAATDAVVALLAALIDLLGRLIGEDLAVNLMSQAMVNHVPDGGLHDAPDAGGATEAEGAP